MIIDDHFANRGNINETLNTLTAMDYNKLHLVYAIRGNRGIDVNTSISDRKSTRLNSSHVAISYAVFCLKKKTQATPVSAPDIAGKELANPYPMIDSTSMQI